MNAPCKDCKDREVGCHGTCEKYLEEKRKHDDHRKAVDEARRKERVFNDYVSDRNPKIIREYKRKIGKT